MIPTPSWMGKDKSIILKATRLINTHDANFSTDCVFVSNMVKTGRWQRNSHQSLGVNLESAMKWRVRWFVTAGFMMVSIAAAQDTVRSVDRPEAGPPNAFYSRQSRAAFGQSADQTAPDGRQAARLAPQTARAPDADGFHGHLDRDQRLPRRRTTTPGSARGRGPARLGGAALLAQGLRRSGLCAGRPADHRRGQAWIEAAIASQRDDGYFGPRPT